MQWIDRKLQISFLHTHYVNPSFIFTYADYVWALSRPGSGPEELWRKWGATAPPPFLLQHEEDRNSHVQPITIVPLKFLYLPPSMWSKIIVLTLSCKNVRWVFIFIMNGWILFFIWEKMNNAIGVGAVHSEL